MRRRRSDWRRSQLSSEFERAKTFLNIAGRRYVVESDLHTHTTFSDGRGSIEDNVRGAIDAGLKQVALTEHGPGHVGFGIARKNILKAKNEVMRVRREYPDIEILFGIEANIIAPYGRLDIRQDEFGCFDFVCAGWHFAGVDGLMPVGLAKTAYNVVRNAGKKQAAGYMRENTDTIVRAINGGGIKFLTHPGDKVPVYMREIAAACEKTGTLLEINTAHMSLTPGVIKSIMRMDVNFIICSDAHNARRVGDFRAAEALINESGLDPARVVNLRRL